MSEKYFIKTYGCQMNVYDSHRMAMMLEEMGYQKATSQQEADLVLFNTCHIILLLLSLGLFVFWVFTNYHYFTFTFNNFTFSTNWFYRWFYFHNISSHKKRCPTHPLLIFKMFYSPIQDFLSN